MKVQTKDELDCKKKELGGFHKLGFLKGNSVSTKSRSISMVSASDAKEDRDYSGTPVNIARAVDIFFIRRGQVLQ